MANSSTIQMDISLYMFLAQFPVEKQNIFHERLGSNFFSRETRDNKQHIFNLIH